MVYFVLNIQNASSATEDWLSDQAFQNGALGISEVLGFHQPEGEEEVFTEISERRNLEIFFSDPPPAQFLTEIRHRWPEVGIAVRGEKSRDWLAEWKKGFVPFALVEDFWVVPSWCKPPLAAVHKIWIDPGMAFGTGTHETTQLVAQTLVAVARENQPASCLDVGTGTGILAILARQLGIAHVQATEIEVEARRVAKENFTGNACSDIMLNEKQIEQLNGSYDVVMANIIDGVLVRVQDTLKMRVRPGGWLIVSGIISERENDFLAGFRLPPGHTWMRRVQKGDWLLFATRL